MVPYDSFRLYIIGLLGNDGGGGTLTTFAEYETARGLARKPISRDDLAVILRQIGGLKAFVESGGPAFDIRTLKDLGEALFDLLIVGKTRDLFFKATGERRERGFLPLEIIAEDHRIAGWPWEFLYDRNNDVFIAQEFHPISRSIFTSNRPQKLGALSEKIRLLIILGVRPDDPKFRSDEEINSIANIFTTHLGEEEFELRIFVPEQKNHLVSELASGGYHIVHYFGHAGFDPDLRSGYLAIERSESAKFKLEANLFAQTLYNKGIRLVFLNACKTAVGAPDESPARSSVAAALLDRGIPAVIAAQFSLPEASAHFLAATIYNTLLLGTPVEEAIRDGRSQMSYADSAKFFDWGIPVLYSTDPKTVIFPRKGRKPSWAKKFEPAAEAGELVSFLAGRSRRQGPSVVVRVPQAATKRSKFRVAFVDIDARVGFLPEVVGAANGQQDYYRFEVAYLPVPSGYVQVREPGEPQTYLPRVRDVLGKARKELSVDFVCGLTRHMVSTDEWSNLFAATLPGDQVIIVSTFDVREYAEEARVPFAKAVLMICLSMLVAADPRWRINFHQETFGCMFDFCENRDDIVVGLRKMRFDHQPCRDKIGDALQLRAIDALARLSVDGA